MEKRTYQFQFDVFHSIAELPVEDANLLRAARGATANAYAPYSHFRVGAAALLENGEILTGSNQENASFPAGLCAERVLLSAASAQWPGTAIRSIAISYHNENENTRSDHPSSPCGICRQSLQDYEQRFQQSIRLILSGMDGEVWVVNRAASLLPFAFEFNPLA